MVIKFLLFMALVWASIGWAVVGIVTTRNVRFFSRVSLATYVLGSVVTAALWPNVIPSLLFNPRPRRPRDRKPNRTTR